MIGILAVVQVAVVLFNLWLVSLAAISLRKETKSWWPLITTGTMLAVLLVAIFGHSLFVTEGGFMFPVVGWFFCLFSLSYGLESNSFARDTSSWGVTFCIQAVFIVIGGAWEIFVRVVG